jgi:EmrB/QacA subfamily drug resistance transporter
MTAVVPTQPETRSLRRAWLSLLAVVLGILVVQLDGTVVAIANPAIAADLGADLAGIQWVTTAYLLVLAGLLIPAGNVADRIGRKKAFLIGIGGFSLGSLLCGLAPNVELLVGARVLQAVFGALLGPAALAVVRAAFPPEKLAAAFGVFGSASAVALGGGPLLGGVLVEYASWQWAFFVNLPFGIVAIAVGLLVLDESGERSRSPLDLPGAVTLTVALASLVWGVTHVQPAFVSWNGLGALVLGLALLAVFIVVERRGPHPMVPLELFTNRTFAVGSVLTAVTMVAFFAVLFYLTFFLQNAQGRTEIATALALLPLTLTFLVSSPAAGAVSARVGVRPTLMVGAAFIVASLGLLLFLDVNSGVGLLAPALVLAGFGVGFLMMPAATVVIGSAPVEQAGVVSGIQQSLQQLGSTLGVAVFGSVLAAATTARLAGASNDPAVTAVLADPSVRQGVQLGFGPASAAALEQAGVAQQVIAEVTRIAHETFVAGVHTVFAVGIAVAVVAGLLALWVRTPKA